MVLVRRLRSGAGPDTPERSLRASLNFAGEVSSTLRWRELDSNRQFLVTGCGPVMDTMRSEWTLSRRDSPPPRKVRLTLRWREMDSNSRFRAR